MLTVQQNTTKAFNVYFGVSGLTITATLSKNGGAFNAVSPTITDRSNGYYSIAPIAAHRDTIGENAWLFSASGQPSLPRVEQVIAADIDAAIQPVNVTQMEPNVITASAIADNAITDAKVASDVTIASVTGSVGSVAGNVSGSVGSVVGNVGGNVAGSVASVVGAVGSVTGLNVAHIDAAISSRATDSLLITVAGYLDTEIAAIKAKTDQLTFTAAGFVDCNLYRWRGTQPGNLDANSFVPSNLAAVNGSSTRASTLSTALDGNYFAKLNVSGTLAHTDNAASFMADTSALATKIDVTNAGLL